MTDDAVYPAVNFCQGKNMMDSIANNFKLRRSFESAFLVSVVFNMLSRYCGKSYLRFE